VSESQDKLKIVLDNGPLLRKIRPICCISVESTKGSLRGGKSNVLNGLTIRANLFAACASFGLRLSGGIDVKFAVALLALASCAGALRGQQVLTVNKYACAGSSYIANAANLPNAGGVSAQCGAEIQTAVLNDPVVYFVSIVSTNSTSVLTTLVDNLPTYFTVLHIVCKAFGTGASFGDCGSTYSSGSTLTVKNMMIPSTGGASVVIEVEGYFTATGADLNDFNNCATGTPSALPLVGQQGTNTDCKLVTVPATPAPWDLGVRKTFIQGTVLTPTPSPQP